MTSIVISEGCEGCEGKVAEKKLCVDFSLSSSKKGRYESIYLTINLSAKNKPTPVGVVRVAVRKCRLEFVINNGEMPLEHRALPAKLRIRVAKQRTTSADRKKGTASSNELKIKAGLEMAIKGAPKIEGASKGSTTAEECFSTVDVFNIDEFQFSPGGGPSKPSWEFEDKEAKSELIGSLKCEFLGLLQKNQGKCSIRGRVTAFPRDLSMKGQSRILPENLNSANWVVRQLLLFKWLNKCISPSLCCKCYEIR
jgi:hypothetical protein